MTKAAILAVGGADGERRLGQTILGQWQELRINDNALPHLLAMPRLKDSRIVSLPISPEALPKLKRSKPKLTVSK